MKKSGDLQTGDVCKDLTNPFAAVAQGSGGSPEIVWTIKTMPPAADVPAELGGVTTLSDGTGLHSYVTLKLGSLPGGYTTEAACAVCSNSPVTFTSTAKCPEVIAQYQGDYPDEPYDGDRCVIKNADGTTDKFVSCSEYIPLKPGQSNQRTMISDAGCTLSASAMALDYFYRLTNPSGAPLVTSLSVNTAMGAVKGGFVKGNLSFKKLSSVSAIPLVYEKNSPDDKTLLSNSAMDKYLERCIPIIVKVKNRYLVNNLWKWHYHWVVVTGKGVGGYAIKDPGFRNPPRTNLSKYNNEIYGIRIYEKTGGICK